MKKVRKYGNAPYSVALLHGGPGAPGEMAFVARELSSSGKGILEPLQSADSVTSQVEELYEVLNGFEPLTIVGHSWGAWLGYLFAAKYPDLTSKLILVGSGPFEKKYMVNAQKKRLERLGLKEREEAELLLNRLSRLNDLDKDSFGRLGSLMSKSDSYNPIKYKSEVLECDPNIFNGVWPRAAAMRESGELLSIASKIKCPVVAIHGKYDPHPPEGVKIPLESKISDFKFIELDLCGHTPWIEKEAKDIFFEVLKREISYS